MPPEWTCCRLAEIAEVFDGPHATPRKTSIGPVFLGISNLANGRLDLSNVEHLSDEDFNRWTRRVTPQAGDVVFSYETRLGEAALIPEGLRCCLGRRMGLLRARPEKVDSRFLLYAYLGPAFQQLLQSRTVHGSTVDRIPLIDMPEFPICIPATLNEQRAIARVLGALDDRIELNRRMNETLEAMARAIFKSWFVDFDPVRAKAEGRQPSGMDAVTAALFPDSFEDSRLGKIPNGWRAANLAEFALLNPEVWTRQNAPDHIEYVDLSNVKWGRIQTTAAYLRKDAPSRAQRVLRPGDTIVGTVRPGNGSYAFISDNGLTGSTGFAVLRPRKSFFREIVYLAATAFDNMEKLARLADGAAYPAVRPDAVISTDIPKAPDPILGCFSKTVGPLLNRMAANHCEAHTLAASRDLLLPELLSGELVLTGAALSENR